MEISQNSQENTCAFNKVSGQRDSGTVFSCELCEISKNTFSTEHVWRSTMTKTWLDFHKMTIAARKANSEKKTPNKVKQCDFKKF